jgi:formylglycine-generating enzyme required for sulfatase activity
MNRPPIYDPNHDYYELLGLPPDASEEAIREAYRRRAKEFHPDQNQAHQEWAEKQFKQLGEAYNVLSEPNQRRAYDRARWQAQVAAQFRARKPSSPPNISIKIPDWLPRAALWVWGLLLLVMTVLLVAGFILALNIGASDDGDDLTDTFIAAPAPTLEVADTLLAQMPLEHNTDWQPVIQESDGFTLVLVPAGCFIMGREPASEAARDSQRVCFDRHFWIDRAEITNQQYRDLLGDDAPLGNWEEDERPRENISWDEALRFCRMRGGDLPTGAQWEYAARGPDSWLYPWGNEFDPARVIYRDTFDLPAQGDQRPETAPVGSVPAGDSWVGAADMLGNVQEWIVDGFDDPAERLRILRGGSALNNELSLLTEDRYQFQLTHLADYDGFRCVFG